MILSLPLSLPFLTLSLLPTMKLEISSLPQLFIVNVSLSLHLLHQSHILLILLHLLLPTLLVLLKRHCIAKFPTFSPSNDSPNHHSHTNNPHTNTNTSTNSNTDTNAPTYPSYTNSFIGTNNTDNLPNNQNKKRITAFFKTLAAK
jgi:hypothetical protein